MNQRWHILYRGPLSSCNYGCGYCPFAKRRNTRKELRDDAARLERFVEWVGSQDPRRSIGVLFTPWGEALIHRHYQRAFARLAVMPHVYRVAAQTNLSGQLRWLKGCDREKIALWCTYHPGETTRERFLRQCSQLQTLGIRHSVGLVGLREHLEEMEILRAALPADTYLWVNAFKRIPGYYAPEETERILAVDALFHFNAVRHQSLGDVCHAGETSFTVDGAGNARRCHFISEIIGNIYDENFAKSLRPRTCTNSECGCHIGYVNLQRLGLDGIFGDGILERIPWKRYSRLDSTGISH